MLKIIEEKPEYYHDAELCIQHSFWNVYMPGCEEHYLVHRMRNEKEFVKELSLIALDNNHVVGAIYGSTATYNNEKILTFGPLGVDPDSQKQNIGSTLIREFISRAKKLGYKAIIITGIPSYYPRFGFKSCFDLNIKMSDGSQFDALMGLELSKGFFTNNPGIFTEAPIFFNLDRKEVEKFNEKFPPLIKKNLPGQWKK